MMDFKNSDITTSPVIADLGSADASAALEAAATLAVAMQAGNILPLTADGQLVLPAGVGLDDIKVVGRDLVIQMPDGTQMIVPDGAIFVPQIVVYGVAVPPLNIAALLIGQEPQPAAGRPQSSGGNFADAVGDIGDPFGLGDLLPPTQLAFPEPEEREIVPGLVDRDPDVVIQDGGPASRDVIDNVSEVGLPGTRANGNIEAPGSLTGNGADSTTGTIFVTSPDGIASITINGITVTGTAGQQIVTALGVLTLGALNAGQIGYTYRLTDNTSGDGTTDVFTVAVTDPDGDVATARLTINIADDGPTARNDTDTVPAATYSGQTGNVVTGVGTTSGSAGADTQGADGAAVSGIRAGTGSGTFAGTGTVINGQYGTLTISADGSYTYTRNAGTPGGVNDVFTYQLTDGDGDISTATLTIAIADSPVTITSVPTTGAGTVVDEAGLPSRGTEPEGSNAEAPSESTSGTINFTAPDGVASVQINGTVITGAGQVITTPTGTLLITGYNPATGTLAYTFTLTDNTSGDTTSQVFTITVTDVDGDSDTRPFTVRIIDDVPTARNDSGTQATENAPVTVNVIGNDTQGADAVNLTTGVALVAGSLSGTGTLAYNGDGTFTYTPAPGEQGVVTFNYTITDDDGDVSTATVTINLLEDSTPTLRVAGDQEVNESGLPARSGEPEGSDSAAPTETAVGTITVGTGGDTIASLVINGVSVTAGGTVTTAFGTLVVTLSAGVYSYSYTLNDNTLAPTSNDTFNIVLTDSDGDTASSALVIAIVDDAPTAVADTDSVAAGSYAAATGNVISDSEGDGGKDVQGADGVTVTNVAGAGGSGSAGTAVNGLYGVLTINADGSYSYVRNAGSPGGVSDVFTYTITDGDGDASTTTLTIAIANSPVSLDLPVKGEAGTSVDEAGLPAGSNAAADSEKTTGTINYVAADGPATVTIDGVAVTAVGQLFTGSFGTLKITSIANGVIGYEYLLTTNTSGDATFDDFAVVVTDQDGDSSNGTLVIDIVDDVPTARADVDSVAEDDFSGESESVSADGNVITGVGGSDANSTDGVADTKGADGASVTAVAFGATAGVVDGSTAGEYGTLNLNADGSYTYVLNNFDPRIQGLDSDDSLTEIFTYTLTDGDGDTRTTTLTITINGSDDGITINGLNIQGPDLIVDDDDLPDGSDTAKEPLTQTGSFTINGVDGISSIKIEGTEAFVGQAFTTAYGTFTITSIVTNATAGGDPTSITVNYSYTLNQNVPHPNGAGENTITEIFDVDVTDTDGSTESGTVKVLIIDDVPAANDDSAGPVAENAPVTVNVIGNDIQGADGVDLVTGVALVGGSLTGTGTLVYNADGTFTYTPSAGEEGIISFNYQITDGDGDTDVATVTLDLGKDSTPTLLASDSQVDEEALADGSNPGSNAETTTGSIAITTGNDSIASLIIDGVNVTGGGTVVGTYGTLTVTLTAGVYSYSYTLTDSTTDHPTNPTTGTSEGIFDDFNIVLTDSDGDVETDTITIDILDDGPTAHDDTVNQDVENTAVTFSVFGNDTFGADGVDIDNSPNVAVTFTQPLTGSVSYDPATGLFTFTPVIGQVGTATFSYTIIDGDGDSDEAVVTINLNTDSIPTVTVTDVTVNEDGLPARGAEPAGTSFGSNSHIGSGSFSITTGGDTLQKVEVKDGLGNWVNVTGGGTVNGANGTLVVSVSPAGVYSYVYTLNDNLENHPDNIVDLDGISDDADPLAGEAFDVRVTDSDNSVSGIDTLNVTVFDDAPVANVEAPLQILEDAIAPLSGNVLANDLKGADGAVVTSVRIAGVDVAVAAVGTTAYSNAQGSYTFQANGAWTFDPNSNLNSASGTDASFTYTITDGDGDQASALQPILVLDGAGPTAGAPITLTMDDQNLSDGSTPANPDFVEGSISFTAGSDALTSFAFGAGTGALAGGLTWNRVSDTVIEGWDGPVGTGTKIVILQLTAPASIGAGATGSVTIRATLVNNYDSHPDVNIDDLVQLGTVNVVAADQDGDSVLQTVTLSVSDDLPTATISGPTTVVEGASTAGGTWSRSFGADQPGGSIKVIVDGVEYDLGTTITTAKGSLIVNVDGTWTFTASNNLDQDVAQSFGFSIKVTDADNDFVDRPFAIAITDGAGPAVGAGFTLTLDDQNLAEGTSSGTDDFVSSTLTFTAGSDALTSFVFAPGTGALAGGLSWVRVSNTQIEGFDGLVKIVTLTLTAPASIAPGANGTVTVTATLHDNYDSHLSFTADDIAALGSINVIASDHDGSSVSQTVTLQVSDDVPTLNVTGPNTVVEGTSTVGGLWSQTIGADQPGAVTKVVFGGVEYDLGSAINTGNGTLTVYTDGTWVFAANNNLDNDLNPQVTFSVKVTDADKDVFEDPHTIAITDGQPAADAAPITLELDEAALDTPGALGRDPGSPAETDSLPALSFTAGSDALTSFVFSTNLASLVSDLNGGANDIFWTRSADGQTIIGHLGSAVGPTAITLTLSAPGSIAAGNTGNVTVIATLSDNLPHANALLDQIQSLGSILVEARDHDGNVATGQVTITVKDDVPLANPDTDSVTEDGPTVANGNVLLGAAGIVALPDVNGTDGIADTLGADGATVTAFSFKGNPGAVGSVAGLSGDYGNLVLNANGSYSYVLNNTHAAVQSLSVGQTLTETFNYIITDADGDPSPTTLIITINGADDGVTITGLGGNAEETVFENDLSDGSSPDAPSLTQTGTFAVTAVDGLANIVIGGVTVVSAGVLTATLTVDTPLGLLTITGFTPTLGAGGEVIGGTVSYSYLLQDNSTAHASGNGANGGVFDNFLVVVTDVDGSSNNATLNVEIIDDVPVPVLSVAGLSLSHDETLGLDGDAQDVAGPLAIFDTVSNVGDDLDVAGTAPIGFARDAGALSSVGSKTGADGGTVVFSLELSAAGVNSTLKTTAGADILLYKEGDIIVGRVGSQAGVAAFAIAVEADGSVSMVQYLSLQHPTGGTGSFDEAVAIATNVLLAKVTVTDGDNDVVSTTSPIGNLISFQDDGPSIAAPANGAAIVSLDETSAGSTVPTINTGTITIGNDPHVAGAGAIASAVSAAVVVSVTAAFGVDGPAAGGGLTYALNITSGVSGLRVTDGSAITLVVQGNVVVGRVSGGAFNNQAAFAISIDAATGFVTVEQYLSLQHGDTNSLDETISLALNSLGVTVTAVDGDNDRLTTAVADISSLIRFDDDGPIATVTAGPEALTLLNNDGAFATGSFAVTFGSDGPQGFNITAPVVAGLAYTETDIFDGSGNFLRTELLAKAGVTDVFRFTVNADGTYRFDLIEANAVTTETISFASLGAGGPGFRELADNAATVGVDETGRVEFQSNGNGVNASTQGFGVSNQWTDKGEWFTMEFHRPGAVGNDNPWVNPDLLDAITIRAQQVQQGPVDFIWTANRYDANGVIIATESGTFTVTSAGFINIDPSIQFSELRIENVDANNNAGVRFDTSVTVSRTVLPPDQTYNFNVVAVDGDGDSSGIIPISVFVDEPLVPSIAFEFIGDTAILAAPEDSALLAQATLAASNDNLTAQESGGGDLVNVSGDAVLGGTATARAAEQSRNISSMAATVVAASLVGLAATVDAAAASTPDNSRLDISLNAETATPDAGALIAVSPANDNAQPDIAADIEPARATGDADSNLQVADDADYVPELATQALPENADLLPGGADEVTISDDLPDLAMTGGDAVMHSMLDIAAAQFTPSPDAALATPVDDAIRNALPDSVIDRLIDAFESDAGTPALAGGAATENSGLLIEMLNQSVSNSSDFAIVHVDPFGSQLQDMAATNNG